jgi:hypothetical protein
MPEPAPIAVLLPLAPLATALSPQAVLLSLPPSFGATVWAPALAHSIAETGDSVAALHAAASATTLAETSRRRRADPHWLL